MSGPNSFQVFEFVESPASLQPRGNGRRRTGRFCWGVEERIRRITSPVSFTTHIVAVNVGRERESVPRASCFCHIYDSTTVSFLAIVFTGRLKRLVNSSREIGDSTCLDCSSRVAGSL